MHHVPAFWLFDKYSRAKSGAEIRRIDEATIRVFRRQVAADFFKIETYQFLSFQITLDSYLTYTSFIDKMDASFFPLIEVESVFGNYEDAR